MSSWEEECVENVCRMKGVDRVIADQCQHGATTEDGMPIKKPLDSCPIRPRCDKNYEYDAKAEVACAAVMVEGSTPYAVAESHGWQRFILSYYAERYSEASRDSCRRIRCYMKIALGCSWWKNV